MKWGISHKTCTTLVILEGYALKLVERDKIDWRRKSVWEKEKVME